MGSSRTVPLARAHRTQRLSFPDRSGLADLYGRLDKVLTGMLRPVTLPAMRVLLGLLFIWFGALKVLGRSPVGDLVSGTLPSADPRLTVLVLGGVEGVRGGGAGPRGRGAPGAAVAGRAPDRDVPDLRDAPAVDVPRSQPVPAHRVRRVRDEESGADRGHLGPHRTHRHNTHLAGGVNLATAPRPR